MSFDPNLLQRILEGALLAAGEALTLERLLSLFDEGARPEKDELLAALAALRESCQGRGYDLVEVASGWRFQVAEDLGWRGINLPSWPDLREEDVQMITREIRAAIQD